MEHRERPAPQWPAPEDLLPRILAAVAAEQSRAAHARAGWPLGARMAVAACAGALLVAGQWLVTLAADRGLITPWLGLVDRTAHWLSALLALNRALAAGAEAFFGDAAVQLLLMTTGAVLALVSLATAIGFSQILGHATARDYHGRA